MFNKRNRDRNSKGDHILRRRVRAGAALLLLGVLLRTGSVQAAGGLEPGTDLPAQTARETQVSLQLTYDDSKSWASEYPGYTIQAISDQTVTSKKVSAGAVQTTADSAVLKKNNSTSVKAVGTGTARVTLVNSTNASNLIRIDVTVSPAPLTVMFLGGQSNMEGVTGNHLIAPGDSVACRNGTVYSTYMPTTAVRAQVITGISGLTPGTASNVNDLVAGSLTSTKSISGKTLAYPVNSLTAAGTGKTGPDSGLAWEWNRRTGQKVYVVNAALANSSVQTWVPGGADYERAMACYKAALKVVKAEVKAGHYVLKNKLMFWLQGEADSFISAEDYRTSFLKMYDGCKKELGIKALGMIVVRDTSGNDINEDSIRMSGPRVCQYNMAADPDLPGIWLVSIANEKWVTDSGTAGYFRDRYPSGRLTYPLRSNTTLSGLPSTVAEVHPDAHYSQVGHNENGITAAETMVRILEGGDTPGKVVWRDSRTGTMSAMEGIPGETAEAAVEVSPLSASKKVQFDAQPSTEFAEMSLASMGVISYKAGRTTLRALYDGRVLGQIDVNVLDFLTTPVLTSAGIENARGITVRWNGVEGASGYRIYRKAAGDKWQQLANVTETRYEDTDVESLTGGRLYYYTVRCLDEKGEVYSRYDAKGIAATWLPIPVLTGISADASSLTVKWEAAEGAVKYRVYRKPVGGKWVSIGYTTDTSYKDPGLPVRTRYVYTVRAIAANGSVGYYDGKGITGMIYESPVVKAVPENDGMTVSWKAVEGCSMYRVFYKAADSTKWSKAKTLSETSCKITGLTSGKIYCFTARCMDPSGKEYAGGYVSSKEYLYLQGPELTSVSGQGSSVTVKWAAQPMVDKYILYRKVEKGKWEKLTETQALSYQDEAVQTGVSYTYTLRLYNAQYKLTSGYTPGTRVVNCAMPVLKKITASDMQMGGLLLKWDPVPGAEAYRIYRKIPGGSWKKVKDVRGTERQYLCTGLTSGEETMFTIRCIMADGRNYSSTYSSTGVTYTWMAPVDFYMMKDTDNVKVMWSAVKGAEAYRVYRKTGSSGWTLLGKTTKLSYKDTTVESGNIYYYTVRAAKGSYVSAYEAGGKRIEFREEEPETETPEETSTEDESRSSEESETPLPEEGSPAEGEASPEEGE